MDKKYRIFTINPGSTSTKIALFENGRELFAANVSHDAAKLKEFREISDQFPYRKETILGELAKANISLEGIDAFVGRGGGLVSLESGTYTINETLLHHARIGFTVKHPATLGSQLAYDFATNYGGKAFVVNPPDVDEFDLISRVSGLSDVSRESQGPPAQPERGRDTLCQIRQAVRGPESGHIPYWRWRIGHGAQKRPYG